MADFKESSTPERGWLCTVERHLWHSGIELAIYNKIAVLTHGGESTYWGGVKSMAIFLGCSPRASREAFAHLDFDGWLPIIGDAPKSIYELRGTTHAKKLRQLILHDAWVATHSDKYCFGRDPMPWDGEVHDPLGAQLYRLSGGRLKWYANELKAARAAGGLPDSDLIALWKTMMESKVKGESLKHLKFQFIQGPAKYGLRR